MSFFYFDLCEVFDNDVYVEKKIIEVVSINCKTMKFRDINSLFTGVIKKSFNCQ